MLSPQTSRNLRQEWRKVESLYQFLMDELHTVTEEFDNPSHAAHEVCVLLSVDEGTLPETFYRFYTARVNIDPIILINAVSYFSGAGLIKVDCDCSDEDKSLCEIHSIANTDFYHAGFKDVMEKSDRIEKIIEHIEELRGYILNVN